MTDPQMVTLSLSDVQQMISQVGELTKLIENHMRRDPKMPSDDNTMNRLERAVAQARTSINALSLALPK